MVISKNFGDVACVQLSWAWSKCEHVIFARFSVNVNLKLFLSLLAAARLFRQIPKTNLHELLTTGSNRTIIQKYARVFFNMFEKKKKDI